MKSKRSSHNNKSSSSSSSSKKHHHHQQQTLPNEDTLLFNSSPTDVYSFLDPFSPGTPFPPLLDASEWSKAPPIDVLDRLAPPVLFFPPEVAEEYVSRFCQRSGGSDAVVALESFPAREVPVMRRLATMMAGILSKAAESASKASLSSSKPRNPLFQQHMNASVFNLFSTLSASASEARQRRKLIKAREAEELKKKAESKAQVEQKMSLEDEIALLQKEIEKDQVKGKKSTSSGKGKSKNKKPNNVSNAKSDAKSDTTTTTSQSNAQSNTKKQPIHPPIYDNENIPPPAFFAKDGKLQYGYSARLMSFWRSLSQEERLRLVREEHASLTQAWQDYSEERARAAGWCLCAHCKHRRMTVNDLTDALYAAYCDELAEYVRTGRSALYSPELATATDEASRAKRFLFRSLSVVGEQALLPRYNQFILRLEAFSTQVFSSSYHSSANKPKTAKDEYVSGFRQQVKKMMKERGMEAESEKLKISAKSAIETKAIEGKSSVKQSLSLPSKPQSLTTAPVQTSPTLQASKSFLQRAKQQVNDISFSIVTEDEVDDYDAWAQAEFEGMGPYSWRRDFLFDGEYLKKLANLSRGPQYFRDQYGEEADCFFGSDSEDDRDGHDCEMKGPRGAIQSEDDEDLLDAETDLPVDEAELVLPGGAAVPVLPAGESEGVAQWSEASRIECGRTVFLMFAAEMFQYRLGGAYLDALARERQKQLLAEVEAEERAEREREEKERRAKKAAAGEKQKKKKAAAAQKKKPSASANKQQQEKKIESESETESVESSIVVEPVEAMEDIEYEAVVEPANEAVEPIFEPFSEPVTQSVTQSITHPDTEPLLTQIVTQPDTTTYTASIFQSSSASLFDSSTSIFDSIHPQSQSQSQSSVKPEWEDFDFDPLSLVEQLSREMNGFELARGDGIATGPPGPPGFPPGFEVVRDDDDDDGAYEMPPFMEAMQGFGQGKGMPRMQGMQGMPNPMAHPINPMVHPINPIHHPINPAHQPMHHPMPAQVPYQPLHQIPFQSPTQVPPGLKNTSPPPQESRFASFFSNSIFGPSTFFKDQQQ